MRKFLVPLFFLTLLFSCEKSGFDFTSSSLTLEKNDDVEVLTFSVDLRGEDSGYELLISSPGKMLTWTGPLENKGGERYEATLEITRGASFPEGEYAFTIYSHRGVSKEGSLMFLKEDFSPFIENGVLSGNMSGTGYVNQSPVEIGSSVNEGDRLFYTDEYFNTYSITL